MSGNIKEYIKYIARGISPSYDNDGIVVLNQKCIRNQKILLEESRIHNIHKKSVSQDKILQNFDVLINSTGVGTLGRVAQVKNTKDKMTVDSHITIVRPDLEKIDGEFFGYCIKVQENFIETLGAGATGQTELSRDSILNNLIIPQCSKENQRKIAKILSNYDDLIENNNKRIKILEEIAQKIYKEWFVDFKYPGHETAIFKDTELGKIPSDWSIVCIENIISDIESGSRPKGGVSQCNSGIPSIGAENIIGLGKYDYSKEKLIPNEFYNKMKKGKIENLDVLLYKDGAQIGRKSLFGEGFPYSECCINEHVFILRTNKKCTPYYLYFTLDLPENTEKIKQLNTNAAQPGINQQQVKGVKVKLASIDIINEFDKIVKPIISLIFKLCLKNKELKQTRDLLLPRLMSGEIDVEGLEIS